MKKSVACMLVCGALVASLGLAGCDNASKTEETSTSAQSSATSASEQSGEGATSETSTEATDEPAVDTTDETPEPEEDSPLMRLYEDQVQQMETVRDDYLEALERDYGDWPEEIAEALTYELDSDYTRMTEEFNHSYELNVERLQEVGGSDEELQSCIDGLAEVRDQCLADVTQAIDSYRP